VDVGGFGNLSTALAVGGVIGGILSAALSDVIVAADASTAAHIQRLTSFGWLCVPVSVGIGVAATRSPNLLAAVAGAALFVGASAVTIPRLTHARTAGLARPLSLWSFVGSLLAFLYACLLLALGVRTWGAYTIGFALQPLALLALPPAEPEPVVASGGRRRSWQVSRPYVVAQCSWIVLAQAVLLMVRVAGGADAAGRYGALMRILDLFSVVGPLMATFAFPAFTRIASTMSDADNHLSRLNLSVATAATAAFAVGAPAGWIGWRLAYPHQPFPSVTYGVLAAAVGMSSAVGLPDRILQGVGRARAVEAYALAAAAVLLAAGVILIPPFGLAGAATVRLIAVAGVNIAMLLSTRPRSSSTGYAAMVTAAIGSSVLAAWCGSRASVALTAAAAVAGLLIVAAIGVKAIRDATPRPGPMASAPPSLAAPLT
jgi:O-antigen/teichoic acid export membrane protein